VIGWLGGSAELKVSVEDASKEELYAAAEQLNGEPYLLGFIGSWHDTLEDADVLAGLREWNSGEALEAARQGRLPIMPPAKS
jgi:hypothetical protein